MPAVLPPTYPPAPSDLAPAQRAHWQLAAIDLGRARLGLALSAAGQGVAVAHSVIERKGTRRDIVHLLALLERVGTQGIVVGLPPSQDEGEVSDSARLCRNFALALAAASPRPVWLVDEADTTAEAHAELRLLGLSAARRRREVDRHAAARILDRFLGGALATLVPSEVAAP